ncbi:hydroxymethylglutaryl-CoA reductase [Alteromonas sp. KUL42]|uniref:hydroxymethylglutaryl-CoA reductase n=1 Tax=Alteromonas sp. KUL42 TaxID=2480797 RepID=UPI000792C7B5|nr:hydroxymethylglutaryl-CoA reductase [Alteromonas sp. KUL42]KXJ60343.1 MAG: hydroxymethylglutaryl-CoA reductase [Alteromonas sp. Nap_26]TAP36989.1 hydroxymethylglutaryl-CoA reductase [Alteromonas sp. KUL42]GEA06379.1 hydroxymethylglutaryl-CoA reductase [Alteromonas sp. KUL42]
MTDDTRIPRNTMDDHTNEMAQKRREFLSQKTGSSLEHTGQYSIDPALLPGNVENFIGVVQMPVGIAGPVQINGENADGMFYVPLATTEGTLVASYSRGMRVINECGGVKTTVVEQFMQRAPAFIFSDAREAREFGAWVDEHFEAIAAAAESTTSIGKLQHIHQWSVSRVRYLRFNYTTGDAAGQNMVGKATLAACEWIKANYPVQCEYLLSGNMDTDKKHSHLNMLHSRGKRVIAEIVLKREVLAKIMKVDTHTLARATVLANTGALMAGAAYNGPHSANGIASLFIATGQDEANVVESHAGLLSHELLPNGDLYMAVTLPSLIVATYGGGTGLPTQRECLELMGCYGKGKANKLAEIVAATVLAGDISLGCAVIAGHWVSSHDKYGRNRP